MNRAGNMTRLFAFKHIVPAANFLNKGHCSCHGRQLTASERHNSHVPFVLRDPSSRGIATTSRNCTKRKDDDYEEITAPKPYANPFERTMKILKHDFKSIYDKSQPPLQEFQSHVDLLIIGGGVIGSCIAYTFKERIPRDALKIMVIEKDPTYTQSATLMSVGGLRHHFSLRENIEMAQYSTEFLRQVPKKLSCDGEPPPDIQYHPYGFLQLADEEHAQDLQESWVNQRELGRPVQLLTKERLKDKFPWMNTDGVELACHGVESEGWFDAWALHFGLKRKAIHLGTEYVQAEVVGFEFSVSRTVVAGTEVSDQHVTTKTAVVKTPSGELKTVNFAMCVIAAGHESANIAEMARIGRGEGMLSVQLPVEPRRRYVYCLHAPEGPGIDCPFVVDTDGTYFRREGYAGHFVAGHAPPLGEKPDKGDLDANYDYFNDHVWPSIATRVPGFRNVKLNSAWAGYYDYNRFDQNGIIGAHPYYPHMFFACGFSGFGIQLAPAIARATMELMLDGEFRTIDLHKFFFERFFIGKKVKENIVS